MKTSYLKSVNATNPRIGLLEAIVTHSGLMASQLRKLTAIYTPQLEKVTTNRFLHILGKLGNERLVKKISLPGTREPVRFPTKQGMALADSHGIDFSDESAEARFKKAPIHEWCIREFNTEVEIAIHKNNSVFERPVWSLTSEFKIKSPSPNEANSSYQPDIDLVIPLKKDPKKEFRLLVEIDMATESRSRWKAKMKKADIVLKHLSSSPLPHLLVVVPTERRLKSLYRASADSMSESGFKRTRWVVAKNFSADSMFKKSFVGATEEGQRQGLSLFV